MHDDAVSCSDAWGHTVPTINQTILHYRIIRKLGEGGMGEVYLAEDARLDRQVALKFLPASLSQDHEARERLIREAKAASRLNHKNILTVHAVEHADERDFIVMEYVDGLPLREWMSGNKPSLTQTLRIAMQIADGLQTAHEAGVVHRDVKPSNILVTAKEQVKIADFGLATWRGASELTKSGSTVGTAAYMSPEQAQGQKTDQRSDLFSLGVVIFEMLTGRPPFGGEHQAAIAYAIAHEPAASLSQYRPDLPTGLQHIIDKSLQKDPSVRYQSAADLIADLKRERQLLDSTPSSRSHVTPIAAVQPRRSLRPITVSAIIAAVLVAAVLILRPWRFTVEPTHDAAAVENRLAVMYFDNVAEPDDPQRLGEIATNLLITDLSGSQYVQVVSSQRLYDILKLMGYEGAKKISPDIATQVAQRAGARWMLVGSILRTAPNMVLTAQLIDVASGNSIAPQRIDGAPGEDIFALVDRLRGKVTEGLSIPAGIDAQQSTRIATTTSTDAYRLYLEGMDLWHKYYTDEANEKFYQAIAIDSTFTMAYFRIAQSQFSGAEVDSENRRQLDIALTQIDRVGPKEQLQLRALDAGLDGDAPRAIATLTELLKQYPDEKEAWWILGNIQGLWLRDYEVGAAALRQAIAIDPMYKLAYNSLAYLYNFMGDFEQSLWAINQYIAVAPDEANPYDSRADLYAYNGQPDKALESYTLALSKNPAYTVSRRKQAFMCLFLGRYADADSILQLEASGPSPAARAEGRFLLAKVPEHQGRLREAIAILNKGIAADEFDGIDSAISARKLNWQALLLSELGKHDDAILTLHAARQKLDSTHGEDYAWTLFDEVELSWRGGDFAAAERALQELDQFKSHPDPRRAAIPSLAKGLLESARGHHALATTLMESAQSFSDEYGYVYELGCQYLRAGELSQAVETLERAAAEYSEQRAHFGVMSTKVHYYLAMAYEQSGWNDKAIGQYEKFLGIWKNADPELTLVDDAKSRLQRLRSGA